MLKENLIMLRNIHGLSQEEIAEKIDIMKKAMECGEGASYKKPFVPTPNGIYKNDE